MKFRRQRKGRPRNDQHYRLHLLHPHLGLHASITKFLLVSALNVRRGKDTWFSDAGYAEGVESQHRGDADALQRQARGG